MERFSRLPLEPDLSGYPSQVYADREERHVSMYRVGALTVAGRRELCVVRNISSGGLMLNPYSSIECGARIAVEFKQGESVEGVVAWSNGNNVGVRFDEPIEVSAILSTAANGLRPRMPRINIESRISVRMGDTVHQLLAIDISQGGVCVESSVHLPLGIDVLVRIEGLPAEPAVVRWRNGDCYGLGFNRLLSVTSLAAWLQEHRKSGTPRKPA